MIRLIDSSTVDCCYTYGWLNDSDNKWFILLLLASDEIKGTFQQQCINNKHTQAVYPWDVSNEEIVRQFNNN